MLHDVGAEIGETASVARKQQSAVRCRPTDAVVVAVYAHAALHTEPVGELVLGRSQQRNPVAPLRVGGAVQCPVGVHVNRRGSPERRQSVGILKSLVVLQIYTARYLVQAHHRAALLARVGFVVDALVHVRDLGIGAETLRYLRADAQIEGVAFEVVVRNNPLVVVIGIGHIRLDFFATRRHPKRIVGRDRSSEKVSHVVRKRCRCSRPPAATAARVGNATVSLSELVLELGQQHWVFYNHARVNINGYFA